MTAYLYDLSGEWIAFRPSTDSRYLFDVRGTWIGWFPFHDDEVLTPDGDYLGSVSGDRLIQRFDYVYRGTPGYPGAPAFPGLPAYPGAASHAGAMGGCEDVPILQHA